MRLLRLVGPGEDGSSLLVETADGTEQFTLPIDERLRNVSSSDLPRLPVPESEAGKAPSPREIQTRVRAGESAQQVADTAGIPVERVMRFAFPVLQERIRVVDEAQRARARRGNEGQQVEFGGLIESRLARHGVDPTGVSWDAFRREDGGWTVTATFAAHSAELLAKFSFALLNRTVSALNALAADLLSDRPIQALLPPMPTPVVEEPAATEPVRLAAVPDRISAPEPAGDPSPVTTPAVRPGRRQKAHTRPIPIGEDDELFDQDALDEPLRGQAASTSAGFEPSWHEPPLPLDLGPDGAVEPTPDAEAAEGRGKRGRRGDKPRMPSWDDILLGVRHKSD
ncbi:MAG: septation protein SepH [Actinomycetota bacterium]|nr:septation protein SepH [Actinomycetota bacterium]MDQ2957089.1 septation protein SepH [Actinomycetota bacterium]